MDEQIKRLTQLQAALDEAARADQKKKRLPAELAQAEATLTAAQKQCAAAAALLEKEENLRKDLEGKIDAHRAKATRLRAQLDALTTPAQVAAVEHEIEFVTGEADRFETEALESLERSESEEAAHTTAREASDEAAANRAVIRAGVASRDAEYAAEIATQKACATALRPTIDADLLAEFDRIARARAGIGIARAVQQQCNGCRMGIRLQVWMRLCEGERAHCDSCGRMLYYDDAPAPKADEERPALIPGQGRAPRHTRAV